MIYLFNRYSFGSAGEQPRGEAKNQCGACLNAKEVGYMPFLCILILGDKNHSREAESYPKKLTHNSLINNLLPEAYLSLVNRMSHRSTGETIFFCFHYPYSFCNG